MSPVYFTDRDLGKKFPAILAAAGLTVEPHHDLFLPETPDVEWLEYCGRNQRIAITHNSRIRYTPNELAAVIRHRVSLLVVIGQVPYATLAHNFVNTLSRVETFIEQHQPPYIGKVYRPSPDSSLDTPPLERLFCGTRVNPARSEPRALSSVPSASTTVPATPSTLL